MVEPIINPAFSILAGCKAITFNIKATIYDLKINDCIEVSIYMCATDETTIYDYHLSLLFNFPRNES